MQAQKRYLREINAIVIFAKFTFQSNSNEIVTVLSLSSLEELKDEPLCQHAIEGNCTNTDCVFLHGFQCDHCKKPVIHPFDRIQGRTHVELCSRTAGVSFTF